MKDHAEKMIIEGIRKKPCRCLEYGIKIYTYIFWPIQVGKNQVIWMCPVYLRRGKKTSMATAERGE